VKLDDKIGFISGFDLKNKLVYLKDINQSLLVHRKVNPTKLKLVNRNGNWIKRSRVQILLSTPKGVCPNGLGGRL